jgi:thioredoxin-related protein
MMYGLSEQTDTPRQARGVRWGPTLLIAGALTLYFVMTRAVPLPEDWGHDYQAALAQAAASGRKVILAFDMRGCPPCTAMNRSVLTSPEVKSALRGYVPVGVDIDRAPELAARFEVYATPTYAIIDVQGRLLARREGYQPVESFVSFLREGSESFSSDIAPTERPPTTGP